MRFYYKKCSKCGAKNLRGSSHCQECGAFIPSFIAVSEFLPAIVFNIALAIIIIFLGVGGLRLAGISEALGPGNEGTNWGSIMLFSGLFILFIGVLMFICSVLKAVKYILVNVDKNS